MKNARRSSDWTIARGRGRAHAVLAVPIHALSIAGTLILGCSDQSPSSASTAPMPSVGAPVAGTGTTVAAQPTHGSSAAGSAPIAGAAAPAAGSVATGVGGGVAGTGSAPAGTGGSSGTAPAAGAGGTPASMASGGGGEAGVSGGSMAGMAGSDMPAGGSAGSMVVPGSCMKGAVKASEVIFIGESFIAATNAIPRFTSQLAREAGTIGTGESYRSYAVSGTLLTTGDIPGQYTRGASEGPVKVVLMDGGGNDLLVGRRCQTSFDASCKEIVTVVQTLFARMKAGGVSDVVYFFYPDPMGIGASIKGAMDILRPEMKKACDGASDVRCVWVDQRESWADKYTTYTRDGIHPTDAGSMASANQIWSAMVANCIAQ